MEIMIDGVENENNNKNYELNVYKENLSVYIFKEYLYSLRHFYDFKDIDYIYKG